MNIIFTESTEIQAQQKELLKKSFANQPSVTLKINADEDIKALVTSHITKALNAIKDIRIVEDDYDWMISIVALSLKNNIGHKISVAIASSVLEPFDLKSLKGLLEKHGKLTPPQKEILDAYDNHYFIKNHQVETGSHEELKKICQKIVAEFDAHYLEPNRKRAK